MQTAHAIAEFAFKYQDEFESWRLGSNYLCCLETSSTELFHFLEKLKISGIKHVAFYEPDIGNRLTAIAVESLPSKLHKFFFKHLKLSS